jgi:hypothetical protein
LKFIEIEIPYALLLFTMNRRVEKDKNLSRRLAQLKFKDAGIKKVAKTCILSDKIYQESGKLLSSQSFQDIEGFFWMRESINTCIMPVLICAVDFFCEIFIYCLLGDKLLGEFLVAECVYRSFYETEHSFIHKMSLRNSALFSSRVKNYVRKVASAGFQRSIGRKMLILALTATE